MHTYACLCIDIFNCGLSKGSWVNSTTFAFIFKTFWFSKIFINVKLRELFASFALIQTSGKNCLEHWIMELLITYFLVEVQLLNWVGLKQQLQQSFWAFTAAFCSQLHNKLKAGKRCSSRDSWCCCRAAAWVPEAVHSLRFGSVNDHVSACALTPLEPMQADQESSWSGII